MTVEESIARLADRMDIIELTARYAYLLDTKQLDLLMELWSEADPTFDQGNFGLGVTVGRTAIRHQLETAIYGQIENLCHITTNNVIEEISGSRATGNCTVFAQGDVRVGLRPG